MDGIADIGGMHGFGALIVDPDEPVFKEEWERRAFAMALLSMRVSGTNLDAFRHALDRLDHVHYFGEGYYGRWLNMAELLLLDSQVIAPGAVDARARRLAGEDVEEPPDPVPNKPDYRATGPGSLRQIEDHPKFKVGDRVQTRRFGRAGHTRLPRYVRGRTGVVRHIQPAALLPDTHAHFLGENAQHVYSVQFDSKELWGPDAEPFDLSIDLYESYLEAAS